LIPVDREDVLDTALSILDRFAGRTGVRGRFVALYLGFRRMGPAIRPLGDAAATPASEIEQFMDQLFIKTHRPEPFVVLTAPFGQSTSPSAPYSTRSGQIAPDNKYPTNTWRNNFAIQKGIGCPASEGVIIANLASPGLRLACPHMEMDPEGRHVCGIQNTAYRGDEHSIWLRMTGGGYQSVDLDNPAVYGDYLAPAGEPIPVFPLIAALYVRAELAAYPARPTVGIPDFAEDFGFTLDQVEALFNCDPDHGDNAEIIARVQGTVRTPQMLIADPAIAAGPAAGPMPIVNPAAEINTGVGAELAVAGELTGHGWSVVYRGNQRGFGYDLEASTDEHVLRVEVKSSYGFTTPELTEAEWMAAQQWGDAYVLAVVDFFGSQKQTIWYVRNPAVAAIPVELTQLVFRLPRADVRSLGTEAEFL
jgi:hypothetical protein